MSRTGLAVAMALAAALATFGQNVISASQDARAEADHLTLTTLHAMNVQQLAMLEQQREILDQQHRILEMLEKRPA